MTYKTLFLPLAFEETAAAATDSGLQLAAAFGAHLMAHHVRQRFATYPPVDFFPAGGSAATIAASGHDEATAAFARTMRAVFEERCDAAGANIVPVSEALKQSRVTASWSETTGQIAREYALAARASDLVVAALPDPTEIYLEREILEEILIQSGAPLLMVPRGGLRDMPRRPLVAWDGSLQAARVVRAALPFLRQSEEVVLLTIGETDAGTPGPEAAKHWLERAGLPVAAWGVEPSGEPVGAQILDACARAGSDLVTLGGYSSSRLREAILGGVTLHMLHNSPVPLMMVH